jgi:hypothetical protein
MGLSLQQTLHFPVPDRGELLIASTSNSGILTLETILSRACAWDNFGRSPASRSEAELAGTKADGEGLGSLPQAGKGNIGSRFAAL